MKFNLKVLLLLIVLFQVVLMRPNDNDADDHGGPRDHDFDDTGRVKKHHVRKHHP